SRGAIQTARFQVLGDPRRIALGQMSVEVIYQSREGRTFHKSNSHLHSFIAIEPATSEKILKLHSNPALEELLQLFQTSGTGRSYGCDRHVHFPCDVRVAQLILLIKEHRDQFS